MDKNKLTLAVLDICERLVDYGAYTTVTELTELLGPLIEVLDGSSDLCAPEDDFAVRCCASLVPVCGCDYLLFPIGQTPATGELRQHSKERYVLDERNKFMMDTKLHICNILRKVLDIGLDVRLSEFVAAFKSDRFTEAESGVMAVISNVIQGVNFVRKGITTTMQ